MSVHSCVRGKIPGAFTRGMMMSVHSCGRGWISVDLLEE